MENMDEYNENSWNRQKKDKLNSENIGKIWNKGKLYSEKIWKNRTERQVE
jgi:hypothetical protein